MTVDAVNRLLAYVFQRGRTPHRTLNKTLRCRTDDRMGGSYIDLQVMTSGMMTLFASPKQVFRPSSEQDT